MKKIIFLLLCTLLIFPGCKIFQKTKKITVSCASYSSFQIIKDLLEDIKELDIYFIDDSQPGFIPSKDQINQIICSSLFIFSNQKNQKWISKELISSAQIVFKVSNEKLEALIQLLKLFTVSLAKLFIP